MTIAVDLGRKASKQTNKINIFNLFCVMESKLIHVVSHLLLNIPLSVNPVLYFFNNHIQRLQDSVLFNLIIYLLVNSYGHVETISSPKYFFLGKLG